MVHVACAAYNFVLNEHPKDSVFFLMSGRDALILLVQLLNPKLRHIGIGKSILALDALRDIHALMIHNIKFSR